MPNLNATISQFEREVMLERQKVGVAKAKAEENIRIERQRHSRQRATRLLNSTGRAASVKELQSNSASASPAFTGR